MMKNKIHALAILLLSASTGGCGSAPNSSSNGVDPNVTVLATYSSISTNILQVSCVHCHGSKGGLSFETHAGTLAAVTTGSPSQSRLYTAVSSGAMPKTGNLLSTAQIQAISDWITAGAADN